MSWGDTQNSEQTLENLKFYRQKYLVMDTELMESSKNQLQHQ